MNKSVLKIAVFFFIILLIGLWLYRVVLINRNNSDNKTQSVGVGDVVDGIYGNYSVSNVTVYDFAAFVTEFPDISWTAGGYTYSLEAYINGNDTRVVLVDIHADNLVDNIEEVEQPFPNKIITDDSMYGNLFDIGMIWEINKDFNYKNNSFDIRLPFLIDKGAVDGDAWNKMEKEDIGFKLIIESNPIEKNISLDKCTFIKADEKQIRETTDIAKKAISLRDDLYELQTQTFDQNVFPDGHGYMDSMEINLISVKEIHSTDFSEYDEQYFFVKVDENYPENTINNSKARFFEVHMVISNNSDEVFKYNMGNACLYCSNCDELIYATSELYMDTRNYEGKSGLELLFEPHEKKELTMIYMDLWSISYEEEHPLWEDENSEVYMVFNTSARMVSSFDEKDVVFIKGEIEK